MIVTLALFARSLFAQEGRASDIPADADVSRSAEFGGECESHTLMEAIAHIRMPGKLYCFADRSLLAEQGVPVVNREHLYHLIEIEGVTSVDAVTSDRREDRPGSSVPHNQEGSRGIIGVCATGDVDDDASVPFTLFRLDRTYAGFHRDEAVGYEVGNNGNWINARIRTISPGLRAENLESAGDTHSQPSRATACAYMTLAAGRYELFVRMRIYHVVWFYEL